jgi:type IV secretion system protein TrbB
MEGESKAKNLASVTKHLGPVALRCLEDDEITEIMLNADGNLWADRLGYGTIHIGTMPLHSAESLIRSVAGYNGTVITAEKPLLETVFPLDGSRFAAQFPPVVKAPTFNLRKRPVKVFNWDEYQEQGFITANQVSAIVTAVHSRRNIVVAGGTNTGKTTLLNTIIFEMAAHDQTERLILLEDNPELKCTAPNHNVYGTGNILTIRDLVRMSLRVSPRRIIVGEVRGEEALDLLMAWNTGHQGGATTVHCNTGESALPRLEDLVAMNPNPPNPMHRLLRQAVHVIVNITHDGHGRKVRSVTEVRGYQGSDYLTEQIA